MAFENPIPAGPADRRWPAGASRPPAGSGAAPPRAAQRWRQAAATARRRAAPRCHRAAPGWRRCARRGTVGNRLRKLEDSQVIVGYSLRLRPDAQPDCIRAWMGVRVRACPWRPAYVGGRFSSGLITSRSKSEQDAPERRRGPCAGSTQPYDDREAPASALWHCGVLTLPAILTASVPLNRMTLRVQQGKGSKDRYAMPLDIAMNGPCPPLAPTSTDTRPTTAMDCPAACDRGLGRPWGDPVRGPQAFCRFAHRQSASEEFTCPWDGAKRSRSRPCSPLQRCRQGCATRSQGCPTRRWQAHRCPLPTACSSGISVRQRSSCGCGQRV